MRYIPFVLLIATLFSCQSNKEKKAFHNSAVNTTVEKSASGSLDLDTSPFITTSFPDTVKKILYASNDSGWVSVEAFYLQHKNRQEGIDNFKKVMLKSQFEIDTSSTSTLFWKRKFNKRFGVELQGTPVDTISVINQIWYLGKKYLLITTKYKDWKTKGSA